MTPKNSPIKKAPYFVRGSSGFGGDGGIRTPGTLQYSSFQDYRNRPLCHISAAKVAIAF
tara:strand:+ start:179 stop:355 length:177 start_codon:yes stop_codon:yes gene_type:complete